MRVLLVTMQPSWKSEEIEIKFLDLVVVSILRSAPVRRDRYSSLKLMMLNESCRAGQDGRSGSCLGSPGATGD